MLQGGRPVHIWEGGVILTALWNAAVLSADLLASVAVTRRFPVMHLDIKSGQFSVPNGIYHV